MQTICTTKAGDQLTVSLKTANLKAMSLDDWDMIKDFVLSGVNVFIFDDSPNMERTMQFIRVYEHDDKPATVAINMDIDGFKMTTEEPLDSESLFNYKDTPGTIMFGLWASLRTTSE